nr:MAG TPA: hypothetical protein [Caudoviricetes sp.]DAP54174.1 MAG TPA: hypothetical protein [Caudoviricetes sp.]
MAPPYLSLRERQIASVLLDILLMNLRKET